MGQISQFLRSVENGIGHYCPACRELHVFAIDQPNALGMIWWWNKNIVAPSFVPSMRVIDPGRKKSDPPRLLCHYTLSDGNIEFHGDCTHAFRGFTMALPPLPDFLRDLCL